MPSFHGSGKPKQPRQEKLLKLFNRLNSEKQKQLLDFAEFLNQKQTDVDESADKSSVNSTGPLDEPVLIPRPEEETVVAAIKRLSKTYAMLNKDDMLHKTSDLMSEHILKGRSAPEVIDDLELMFTEYYQAHREQFSKSD